MCDLEGKLTAWLDGELVSADAADVQRHVQFCVECGARVEAYRQVSVAFERYCDAYSESVLAPQNRRRLSRPAVAISGAAALAAAVAALFLIAPGPRVRLSPAGNPAPVTTGIAASQPTQAAEIPQGVRPEPAPLEPVSHLDLGGGKPIEHAALRPQRQGTDLLKSEPTVEIAIPADAIFPPGAAPESVGFTADVTIAPDGSARQIRLRPQFTEFERRSTRP